MSETTSSFFYREVGSDGIDAVRALWQKLNDHDARLSTRFGDKLRLRTFAARKRELFAKADAKKLWVDLVTSNSDGANVAYCISTISAEGVGEIDSIFVEQHLRGQGIGSKLMQRVLAWLDRMGVTSKIVSVRPENNEALAFYRRFDFHPRTILLQENHDGSVQSGGAANGGQPIRPE